MVSADSLRGAKWRFSAPGEWPKIYRKARGSHQGNAFSDAGNAAQAVPPSGAAYWAL